MTRCSHGNAPNERCAFCEREDEDHRATLDEVRALWESAGSTPGPQPNYVAVIGSLVASLRDVERLSQDDDLAILTREQLIELLKKQGKVVGRIATLLEAGARNRAGEN